MLLGGTLGIGLVLLWKGPPDEEVERLKARIATQAERSRVADSLLKADSLRIAGLLRTTDSLDAERRRLAGLAASASQGHADARRMAQEAREALGLAQTAADSLPALVVAYRAETARAEAAELTLGVTREQLENSGRLVAIKDSIIRTQFGDMETLRGDRDHWRDTALEAQRVVDRLQSRSRGFLPDLGRGVETLALGAATYGACRDGVGTMGCLAGAGATALRLAKAL